ncbi:unnamed protein product [Durusdinium trenchii]|uniref:WW domain-containing protein n=1 Tax=Durusdinium trenchii TaxID=1381693 RepID=A0ABP0J0G9_9DINO
MRLPPNWQLLRTNDGRNYFWNPETNQTTWRFPQEDVGAPHPLQKPVSTFRGYTEVPPFRPKERRFSVDGRCFLVECMPADHSCGFHGIGVDRETASSLLFANLHDPEVEEFLARDLLAALQTGNRSSFPVQLRERPELWEMLDKVYDKQKALDHQRREAKAFIRDAGASSPVQVQAEESVETAIRSCFQELKAKVRQQPSSLKLFTLQLLAQCKSHERDVDHANEASKKGSASDQRPTPEPRSLGLARSLGGMQEACGSVRCLGQKRFHLLAFLSPSTRRRPWRGSLGCCGQGRLPHCPGLGRRYKDLSHFDRLVPIDGPN